MAVAAHKKKQVELAVRARKTEKDKNEFTTINKTSPEYAWLRMCMWRLQGGKCPICNAAMREEYVAHDHNHAVGNGRGALCKPCNGALGIPENEMGDRAVAASDWAVLAGVRAIPRASTRRRLERVPNLASSMRAYWEKWEPVAVEMGRAYRTVFGQGKRPKSPALGLVSVKAFVEFGNVLVRLSARARAGMTLEQIAAKQAQRQADWPGQWHEALVHPNEDGNWQGEGDGWTWERFTRATTIMLIAALDWLADIQWSNDHHEQPEGQRVLLLTVNIGRVPSTDTRDSLWAIQHSDTKGEPITLADGRAV